MIKYFTFLVSIIVLYSNSFGQELQSFRSAKLVTGDYATEGTVHLESFDDGSLNLRFETDYKTQDNVFDVHLFLSKTNNYDAPIDTVGMLLVENIGTIDGIDYSAGAMTFNLPNGVDINDYDYLVMVCVQFGRLHWADATFGPEGFVSIPTYDAANDQISVFPNPSRNGDFNLIGAEQSAVIQIMNLQGAVIDEIFVESTVTSIQLSVPGIYIMRLEQNGKEIIRRLISG